LKAAVTGNTQKQLVRAVRWVAKGAPFSKPRAKSGGVYSAELAICGEVGWWRTG
jgi:hypothetical protein